MLFFYESSKKNIWLIWIQDFFVIVCEGKKY